jgi:predicted small secreted protein
MSELIRASGVRRAVAVVVVAAAALCLVACNTVKGVGRDVQEAGEAGERVLEGD